MEESLFGEMQGKVEGLIDCLLNEELMEIKGCGCNDRGISVKRIKGALKSVNEEFQAGGERGEKISKFTFTIAKNYMKDVGILCSQGIYFVKNSYQRNAYFILE